MLLACGSNLHGQLGRDAEPHVLNWTRVDGFDRIVGSSWSQLVGLSGTGEAVVQGFDHNALRHALGGFDSPSCLGHDSIVAHIAGDELRAGDATTPTSLAALDVRGECLLAVDGGRTLQLYPSLDDALSSREPARFALDSPAVSVHAGAGHFLIETADHTLLGLGDNRFGQLGTSAHPRPVTAPRAIDLFDDMPLRSVGIGDHHAAIVDDSGGLYIFGSDAKGQCGGDADASGPQLVTLPVEDGQEQPDVLLIACGSAHTIAVTTGGVFVTGANDSGQLGLGDRAPRPTWTRCPALDGKTIRRVVCSRWTSYVEVA